ncbi:MAG TPA: hypothetical protein VL096_02860, partial [Pirellulaceae bacterium]|nr:hypothetical protein [Pirellulaceae bacterium]
MAHSKILPGYEWHEELDSTNARALLLAQQSDRQLPTVIVADRQTAGRGRGTNQWWSGPGALTFSILLDASETHLPAVHWPLVSLLTAVVVGETL